MHESPFGFFHLDHPPTALVPAGPVVFRGWAAGGTGVPFVDLRVRAGVTLHPAVHGFPRADLPGFFGLSDPFLLAGFEAPFVAAPGLQTVTFEALDIDGVWQTVDSLQLEGQGPASPAPPAEPPPALSLFEFNRALQVTLRRAHSRPAPVVAEQLIRQLPVPAVLRYPHAPFHGHLNQPRRLERVFFGRLCVNGWLFHETARIRQVTATVDLQAWQTLDHGGLVPYVAATYPDFATARDCAVAGWIDVPAQLPSPLCVRVYAELDDGTWHLCSVQRVVVGDLEEEKAGFAPVGRRGFIAASFALHRACAARQLAPPWNRALLGELWRAYGDYRTRALPRAGLAWPSPPAADTTPAVDATPATPTAAIAPAPLRHVTLVTHNLGLEGAPLFLSELARQLAAGGTRLRVISAKEGPLAATFAALGAEVLIVDPGALHVAPTASALTHALAALAPHAPMHDTDLVVANTLSTYWGVHLAHRAGRPSLFYIHESTTPANFYLGHMAPATLPLIERTFRLATHVSFLTQTTRRYYEPWLDRANHSLNPGWIDVPAIDAWLARHPRSELRTALGLAAPTRLIVNVGTVCDRKGQHLFARAVDLLWRRQPTLAATARFLMVGGHDTPFDRSMADLLVHLNRPNLHVVPATSAPLPYYGAADLFVCSSYEESFPRVIMEAMACRVPIVSTAVHGIPEMVRDGREATLVPAGNSAALADAMARVLTDPTRAACLADAAAQRVAAAYDSAKLLPHHAALAARVAAEKIR